MRIEIETKKDFNGKYFSILTCHTENSKKERTI